MLYEHYEHDERCLRCQGFCVSEEYQDLYGSQDTVKALRCLNCGNVMFLGPRPLPLIERRELFPGTGKRGRPRRDHRAMAVLASLIEPDGHPS